MLELCLLSKLKTEYRAALASGAPSAHSAHERCWMGLGQCIGRAPPYSRDLTPTHPRLAGATTWRAAPALLQCSWATAGCYGHSLARHHCWACYVPGPGRPAGGSRNGDNWAEAIQGPQTIPDRVEQDIAEDRSGSTTRFPGWVYGGTTQKQGLSLSAISVNLL